MSNLGNDCGIRQISRVGKPVVYFIDSLDEALHSPNKRDEIRSLLKAIKRLNTLAQKIGPLAYPILFVFSVRYEYWRDWESIFEGLRAKQFVRTFSTFTSDEINLAIEKYESVYSFKISGVLDQDNRNILAQPFNLMIFAEANEYQGLVNATELFGQDVLDLYFNRKHEDLYKRPIPGFDPDHFMRLCGYLADFTVSNSRNKIEMVEFNSIIKKLGRAFDGLASRITQLIISEQILTRDSEDEIYYRFRHFRFIEYLVAYHLALEISHNPKAKHAHILLEGYFDSGFISAFNVHEFVREIARRNFRDIVPILAEFYTTSAEFTKRLLRSKRSEIAAGFKTKSEELDIINRSLARGDPVVCWDGFFVVAAKKNRQPAETILKAFETAWITCSERFNRRRIISKIADLGMLTNEKVLSKLLNSKNVDEWLSMLDELDRVGELDVFIKLWEDGLSDDIILKNLEKENPDTYYLLDEAFRYVLKNKKFPKGLLIDKVQ